MTEHETFTMWKLSRHPAFDAFGREVCTVKPIEVVLGTVAGNDVTLGVKGLSIDTPLVYLGENESMHSHGMPRRRGSSFAFRHPAYHDIALVLFENARERWFEGFAPLLDDSWDNRGRFAYRDQRLRLLRILRMAQAPEAEYG